MDVGLNSSSGAAKVHLCIAVVAVVRLSREPSVDVVTIANQESARVSGAIVNAVARRVLGEKPSALNADF